MNILNRGALAHKVFHNKPILYRFLHHKGANHPTISDHGRLRTMEDQYTADMSTCLAPAYNHIYKDICKETIDCLPKSHMMVSPSQALFLHHLVKMLRPNNILEIGGFTGASAVAMGAALPSKGRLLSLELDPEPLEIAKRNVEASVLKDKIKFQLGPALDSMIELTKQTPKPQFDFIFLDANKGAYIKYYDVIMENDLLSDNGVLVADNVLLYGQVHREAGYDDPQELEASKNIKKMAKKLDAFNKHVSQDPRSEVVILPIYDGVSIIRKSDNLS